jgi:hypothetical protein
MWSPSSADRSLDPSDLRRGDILLLEPGAEPRLVSEVVSTLDGSEYSHALLVESLAPDFYTLSANPEVHLLVSGVNAVALGNFVSDRENPRGALVLRARAGAEAAADFGRQFVERAVPPSPRYPETDDESRFGWEHLVISALAAVARHLEPGALSRRLVGGSALALSKLFLPADPCLAATGVVSPHFHEWDCCHFVDHCFCAVGAPLGAVESDPDRRELGAVLECLALVWEQLTERFIGEPELELPESVPGEPDLDGRRVFVKLAGRMAATFGVGPVQLFRQALAMELPEEVWPPFLSPRLMLTAPALERVGYLRRGSVPSPVSGSPAH